MRGKDEQQLDVFSYISPEQRVPQDHPLRSRRAMTDEALRGLQPRFNKLYSKTGSPSIAPEKLLRIVVGDLRHHCFRSDRWDALHDRTGDRALNARHNQPDQHRIAPTEHRSASRLYRRLPSESSNPEGRSKRLPSGLGLVLGRTDHRSNGDAVQPRRIATRIGIGDHDLVCSGIQLYRNQGRHR